MNTDPISDLLTRMRNAQGADHAQTIAPYSKIKENILKVMKQYGFIKEYAVEKNNNHQELVVQFNEEKPRLSLKRVSSPGQRIYIKNKNLKSVKSGIGINIVSTSKGIMSNVEARKQNLGGELICEVY